MPSKKSVVSSKQKQGLTGKKKAGLGLLANRIADAQYDIMQLQASVAALTEKSSKFQNLLAVAEGNKAKTLSNKLLMDGLLSNTADLKNNSEIAFNEIVRANARTKELAAGVKQLIDKLIYSAELIDKLFNMVIRKEALNPLISDELVSLIGRSSKDANNAVALTLVALQSTFTAQSANIESEAAASMEYFQAIQLYEIITGTVSGDKPAKNSERIQAVSLSSMIDNAYAKAKEVYDDACIANQQIIEELNKMTAGLNKAQVKLESLQSGLAAANAASLAS